MMIPEDKPLDPVLASMSKSNLYDYAYDVGFLAGVSAGRVGDFSETFLTRIRKRVKTLVDAYREVFDADQPDAATQGQPG